MDNHVSINTQQVTMFAGKGGVGKTTCAAAAALHYASLKQRTLAISTDPTPSLGHIFEAENKQRPVKVSGALYLEEIGMDQVKEMWDRKFGREVYQVFSTFVDIGYDEFVDYVSSVVPGLRDEFMVDYIREITQGGEYSRIIWDTAPLGQTLGLLGTPAMLGKHLKTAPRIYSRMKLGTDSRKPVLDIIKGWEELSAVDMDFLRTKVSFIVVTIAEALAVEQLDDTFNEFAKYGLRIERLVINNVIEDTSSQFLLSRSEQQQRYIDALHDKYPDLEMVKLPMFPHEIKGIDRLKDIEARLFGGQA